MAGSMNIGGNQIEEITLDDYTRLMADGSITQRTLPITIAASYKFTTVSENLEEALRNSDYLRRIPADVNAFMLGESEYALSPRGGSGPSEPVEKQQIPVVFYTVLSK